MREHPQSGWAEEAEARSVCEFAQLHRAAAEPGMTITGEAGPTGLMRFRDLILRLPASVIRRQHSPDRRGKGV